mgnify:CR=1 FL=1
MLLLKETRTFEYSKEDIEENKDDGTVMVKGILQRADTENQNGRIYPYDILMNEVKNNYSKLVKENRAFGELDHLDSAIVNLKNVSHMIREIWIEDKVVYGKVQLLDTPCGNIVKAIIKAGGKPGISSRALGSVQKQEGVDVVQKDLQIICWDFVSEPSTHGAFMQLSESREVNPEELKHVFTQFDRINRALNEILALKEEKKQ